ncbi:unnamed protein product [Rhizophagus irregularis]|nr:unnamed protein product [Rhizophagus irregularis]CAB4440470.1 unnamed protein product [Rhizophagus irregularis]
MRDRGQKGVGNLFGFTIAAVFDCHESLNGLRRITLISQPPHDDIDDSRRFFYKIYSKISKNNIKKKTIGNGEKFNVNYSEMRAPSSIIYHFS